MTITFSKLGLKNELLQALDENGYLKPFPIQEKAVPAILSGRDIIGQSHTGTGKTAAYSLPILMNIKKNKVLQALILVPTRELAIQVTREIKRLSKYTGIKSVAIYGGQSINNQIVRLNQGAQVAAATPGRLIDHIKRKSIDLDSLEFVVIDEADRMLDMGFIEDIDYILRNLKNKKQMCLFSATIFPEIIEIIKKYMDKPINIKLNTDDITLRSIEQSYLITSEKEKYSNLCTLIDKNFEKNFNEQILVFTATKQRTRELEEKLRKQSYKATSIHGDLSQRERNVVMHKFRNEQIPILVATDIAARGIDVPTIKCVINYDIPRDPITYFHRIGRTARANSNGKTISLVAVERYSDFERILKYTKYTVYRLNDEMGIPIPRGKKNQVQKKFGAKDRKKYALRRSRNNSVRYRNRKRYRNTNRKHRTRK